jgi:hypothetical protein
MLAPADDQLMFGLLIEQLRTLSPGQQPNLCKFQASVFCSGRNLVFLDEKTPARAGRTGALPARMQVLALNRPKSQACS